MRLTRERGANLKSFRGSLSAEFFKRSPAWEPDRMPAPRFINDAARPHLPGNYYGLKEGHALSGAAIYLDQSSAHHNVALQIPLPHPNRIRARGKIAAALAGETQYWRRRLPEGHIGLVAATVTVNSLPRSIHHLLPPFLHKPGRRVEFLHTNELHYFDNPRNGVLEYITAAWTATAADPVLPEYAQWCLGILDRSPVRDIKPLLLSAYGMLAVNPAKPSAAYYPPGIAKKGMRTELPIAGPMREIWWTPHEDYQSKVTNVIARGMIEAEVRSRSLSYANELHDLGIDVLCIYADGIIVDTDRLPFLPEGWRVSHALTNVHFHHPNSFTSAEVSKLPGVPRKTRERMYDSRRPFHHPVPVCDSMTNANALTIGG